MMSETVDCGTSSRPTYAPSLARSNFGEWRLNLRSSNTEPLVRLNVESRGNPALVDPRVAEIRALMAAAG